MSFTTHGLWEEVRGGGLLEGLAGSWRASESLRGPWGPRGGGDSHTYVRTYVRMHARMYVKLPPLCSKGHRPLPGPLPKRELFGKIFQYQIRF